MSRGSGAEVESPIEKLLQTAQRGELHHALILHGPAADLLRETATALAKTLNCLNGTLGDDCVSCSKIDRGIHPDVETVAVAEDRKMIAVEQVRDLIAGATMRPYEGRTKVFIVDGVETVSVSGANALLKTLEEPTRDTVFLLLTRSPDLLLPTIRSRCQSVSIRSSLARAQGAKSRDEAERMQAMFPAFERRELQRIVRDVVDTLAEYAESEAGLSLLALAAIVSSIEPPSDALALYAALLRDVVAGDAALFDDAAKIERIREKVDRDALLRSATLAMRAVQRLIVNIDVRLAAEQAVAEIARK